MLDLRLYRVTLLPFAIVLIVAAFSLHPRPTALANTLPQQTFDGAQVARTMRQLAANYPDRTPGSAADDALAAALATQPPPVGFASKAFPSLSTVRANVETTSGARSIQTVIASRAGTGAGIALIADRGTAAWPAALSGTATLLELASIYTNLAPSATHRPLTLVSTSGGASAMGAVAAELPRNTEAAIVIGDVADANGRGPYVVPWSGAGGLAPIQLRRTVAAAIAGALGSPGGDVSLVDQLARLALPLTTGPQGPLEAAGIPAVLVAANGESEPPRVPTPIAAPHRRLRPGPARRHRRARRRARAAERADARPRDRHAGAQRLGGASRRRAAAARCSAARSTCSLGRAGAVRRSAAGSAGCCRSPCPSLSPGCSRRSSAPAACSRRPCGAGDAGAAAGLGAGVAALVSVGLLFVLAWVLRAAARARSRHKGPPESVGAGAALLAIGTAAAALVWLGNPYTAALLILPLHLWLVVLTREHARPPLLGAVYLLLSLAPLIAAIALLSSGLRVEPLALLWTLVLLIAGGGLSVSGLLLASLTAGCFVAAAALLLRPGTFAPAEQIEVTVRGPLSYAGPGSLGGTESALRR